MKIDVIGVPLNLGCDRAGADTAPDTLRQLGMMDLIRSTGKEAYDLGNIYVPPVENEDKYKADDHMKHLDTILRVTRNLADAVHNTIQAGGFPLIIGGDHSLGLGTGTGISMSCDNVGIIWIDAHGDINTNKTSPSGNIHGMPLAALIGEGDSRLINLYKKGVKIKPENIFIVGARDLDEGENELIERRNLNVYTMDTIKNKGIDFVITDIHKKIKDRGIENLHMSFDIDVMDPSLAPGTGTRVDEGMTIKEMHTLLEKVIDTNKLRSMGLVELNPLLDKNNITANLCLDIVEFVVKRL